MSAPRSARLLPAALAVVVLGACSSGPSGTSASPAATDAVTVSTTVPVRPQMTVASGPEIDPSFRQGVAKAADGWVFSTNNALFRTDEALVISAKLDPAIPPEWASQGFDHVGDIDVAGGVIYAPLEQPDYGRNRQAMARYDLATLAYLGGVVVTQSHDAWVAVDAEAQVAYSMSGFTDQTILRYDLADGWKPIEPLALDVSVARVQGGDVRDGYLWLSTDDATDGVYRVDLGTGHVDALGSIGRVAGEAEGIDATVTPAGDLHVVQVDAAIVPIRLVELKVS